MSLILAGRIVPLSRDPAVAPTESASFRGRVYVGDDGRIAAIRRSRQTAPPGFGNAVTIDVGTSLIVPGLIDMHNHLAYAPLPLWAEAGRTQPFGHHNIWPSRPSYAAEVTWPAYAYVVAAPAELLAYAEVRALIGGATSIQGSPPSNRPLDGWLIRNIEDETLGGTLNRNTVLASTLTMKPQDLGSRAGPWRGARRSSITAPRGSADRSSPASSKRCERRAACCPSSWRSTPTRWTRLPTRRGLPRPGPWSGRPSRTCGCTARSDSRRAGRPFATASRLHRLRLGALGHPQHPRRAEGRSAGIGQHAVGALRLRPGEDGDGESRRRAARRRGAEPVGRLEPGAPGDMAVIAAAREPIRSRPSSRRSSGTCSSVLVGGKPVYGTEPLMRQAARHWTRARWSWQERRAPGAHAVRGPGTRGPSTEVLARMERCGRTRRRRSTAHVRAPTPAAVGGEPAVSPACARHADGPCPDRRTAKRSRPDRGAADPATGARRGVLRPRSTGAAFMPGC